MKAHFERFHEFSISANGCFNEKEAIHSSMVIKDLTKTIPGRI